MLTPAPGLSLLILALSAVPGDEEAGHSELSLIGVQLTGDPSFHPMLILPDI